MPYNAFVTKKTVMSHKLLESLMQLFLSGPKVVAAGRSRLELDEGKLFLVSKADKNESGFFVLEIEDLVRLNKQDERAL